MTNLRLALLSLALVTCAVSSSHPNGLLLVQLKIAPQPIDRAINEWARRTGMQVLVPTDGLHDAAVSLQVAGYFTPEGALGVMLANSGLRYERVTLTTIAIYQAPTFGRSVRKLTARWNAPSSAAPSVDAR